LIEDEIIYVHEKFEFEQKIVQGGKKKEKSALE